MIKSFAIFKRKSHLTKEECLQYWKEQHGPLAASVIPGFRKYVQYHPLSLSWAEFKFDAIAEFSWDDLKSLEAYFNWRKSEEAKVLIADEEKFIDTGQTLRFFAEEYVIKEH